jgi:hypothetical protein
MLCMIETQDITLFCEDFGPKLTDIGEVTKCSPKKFTLFPIFLSISLFYMKSDNRYVCLQTVILPSDEFSHL